MTRFLIITLSLFIFSCSSASQSYWTYTDTKIAQRNYQEFEDNKFFFLNKGNINEEDKENIKPLIKDYYDDLLKHNGSKKNKEVKKLDAEKMKSLAYYNFYEGVRNVITSEKFEMFQTNQSTHYTKKNEKHLKNYLLEMGLINI